MLFHDFANVLDTLEHTDSRNKMTEVLADLFKKVSADEFCEMVYLLQGKVTPLYDPLEFGVAEKMMLRAIADAVGKDSKTVQHLFKKTGDLGNVAEELLAKGRSSSERKTRTVTILEAYKQLLAVAKANGEGSQEIKIKGLSDLIASVDPLSARYIVRIPLNKLRLGFSDMTILDSLSWMLVGDKSKKKELETYYHVRPDLGYLCRTVKQSGISGLSKISPKPGVPILMARANRLSSAAEIIKKIGECAVEFKYDGLRLQVHYQRSDNSRQQSAISHQRSAIRQQLSDNKKLKTESRELKASIKMFSRNLEDVTPMFPDIAAAVEKQITADSVILEGEIVAYNPKTGVSMPFQQTMQRKRKYDIAQKTQEIPVKLFAFELLYCDGKSYIEKPYIQRKKKLQEILRFDPQRKCYAQNDVVQYAQEHIVSKINEIEDLFDQSVNQHFEGIIAKKLDGLYEAGMRGWSWIKFKRAMSKRLSDTVDVVVMGLTRGQGKRTSFGVGQFLTGIYDANRDMFVSISKIGTGLTDDQFREFNKRVKNLAVSEKPKNYDVDALLTPDVWLTPALVVEVGSDEITRSAVHTAGRVMKPSKSGKALTVKESGYALRFPRLERFRNDKKARDVTTLKEIVSMYTNQKK